MTATRIATRFASIAAAAVLAAATAMPAAALTDPSRGAKPAAKPAPADPTLDKRQYCIKDTFTGSHLSRKVCKTRTEWIASNGVDPAKK
jgi:hypothetical protein